MLAARRSPSSLAVVLVAVLAACSGNPQPANTSSMASTTNVAAFTPEEVAAAKKEQDQRMAWWREARFGMFVHWGLYAIPAGAWNGATHHGEWIRDTARIPVQQYWQNLLMLCKIVTRSLVRAHLTKNNGVHCLQM
jgi:alpha-L-fucosidase